MVVCVKYFVEALIDSKYIYDQSYVNLEKI